MSIEGTSNVHSYTASSTVIPTTSLTSPRDGIDKNMHKALKATEHPDIRFRLRSLDAAAGTATGQLAIAGVEKDVILNVQVKRQAAGLAVLPGRPR